jgi:hypothetical protein
MTVHDRWAHIRFADSEKILKLQEIPAFPELLNQKTLENSLKNLEIP